MQEEEKEIQPMTSLLPGVTFTNTRGQGGHPGWWRARAVSQDITTAVTKYCGWGRQGGVSMTDFSLLWFWKLGVQDPGTSRCRVPVHSWCLLTGSLHVGRDTSSINSQHVDVWLLTSSSSPGRPWLLFWIFTTVCCCCSVAESCRTLCDPMDCSTPGFPSFTICWSLLKLFHRVSEAIQPSHPLSPSSLPAFNFSQHQSLFQSVSSLHQVVKVLELQLQHQSFQWIFSVNFL